MTKQEFILQGFIHQGEVKIGDLEPWSDEQKKAIEKASKKFYEALDIVYDKLTNEAN